MTLICFEDKTGKRIERPFTAKLDNVKQAITDKGGRIISIQHVEYPPLAY